jgi:hypothetical protein
LLLTAAGTSRTVHFLLPGIVDGVLVPGEIIRPREDGVARLTRRGVESPAADVA